MIYNSKRVELIDSLFRNITYEPGDGDFSDVIDVRSELTESVLLQNITYEQSPMNFMKIGGLTPSAAGDGKDEPVIEISDIKARNLDFDRFGYVFSTAEYSSLDDRIDISLKNSVFENINFQAYGQVFLIRHQTP